jgi:hypothetical protein
MIQLQHENQLTKKPEIYFEIVGLDKSKFIQSMASILKEVNNG